MCSIWGFWFVVMGRFGYGLGLSHSCLSCAPHLQPIQTEYRNKCEFSIGVSADNRPGKENKNLRRESQGNEATSG